MTSFCAKSLRLLHRFRFVRAGKIMRIKQITLVSLAVFACIAGHFLVNSILLVPKTSVFLSSQMNISSSYDDRKMSFAHFRKKEPVIVDAQTGSRNGIIPKRRFEAKGITTSNNRRKSNRKDERLAIQERLVYQMRNDRIKHVCQRMGVKTNRPIFETGSDVSLLFNASIFSTNQTGNVITRQCVFL